MVSIAFINFCSDHELFKNKNLYKKIFVLNSKRYDFLRWKTCKNSENLDNVKTDNIFI